MQIRIHKLSLNYLITFSLMVLLPFFLFGYFINYYYGHYLINEMEHRMSETVSQVAQNLENEISNVSILSSSLVHNSEFLAACSGFNNAVDPGESYLHQEEMDVHLSNLFLSTNKIGSIYIYTENKKPFLFKNFPVHDNSLSLIQPDIDSMVNNYLTNNVIQIQDQFFSLYKENNPRKEPLLTLVVKPDIAPLSEGDIQALLFSFRVNLLKQLYRQKTEHGYVLITNSSGDILLSNTLTDLAAELLHQTDESSKKWVTVSARIHATDWTVTQAYEHRTLLRPFLKIRTLFNIILSGIMVIFALYTVLFFHNMITPLNNLAVMMDRVEQGDYSVRIPAAAGPEEMKHLQYAFNSMISRVDQLTVEKEQNEQEKNRLELQALQYQINPHFVANTLNAIRMMAVVNKDDHIKNMTSSLMRLVNDSFRAIGNQSTIAQEIENLRSYVHIMKVRFGNPIQLHFSIPEELMNWNIRKMLLQPLVENAVIHGFQQGKRKGIILIQAFSKDDKLFIRITDNGMGMELSEDGAIPYSREKDKGLTALGLHSVNRRIQLNYGADFGLKIKSRKESYSSLTLTLPGTADKEPS
jgi:two-component system, sensor histidine kinase YesM